MRILMIAPEPFFRLRGTPFSIRQRVDALLELGYEVDLLTYPFGDKVELKGLRIFRSFRPFWIKDVVIGPSWAKIPLDFFLFLKALRFALKNRYHFVHTHEEAGFMGAVMKKIFRLPHLYDMHSSLPEQLVNYKFIRWPVLLKLAKVSEGWLLKNSSAIIAVCPYLAEWAKKSVDENRVFLIENLSLFETGVRPAETIETLREVKEEGSKIVLYTGTFEYNQGLDILLEAVPLVKRDYPRVKFVLVGGQEEKIEKVRRLAEKLGLSEEVIFTGKRPLSEMSSFMAAAEVLVSPRRIGNNTPLKIYSYLFSGKPIVATNIYSHTQVLNGEISVLTAVTAEGVAGGILKVLTDEKLGENLANKAKKFASERFSRGQYLLKLKNICRFIKETK